MSIIKRIKRRLPIVGAGGNVPEENRATPQRTAVVPPPIAPPTPQSARGDQGAEAFIGAVVKEHQVVLFMKGSPDQPMCGFSANAAGILRTYGEIHHVDVLMDPEVRETVKEYSQWPTIPQIYVGGEFLGGSDILMQMHEAGELKELIDAAGGEA